MGSIVFDLDGTLVDTSRDLIAAANACFRAMGAGDALDPVADAATAFAGGRAMLRLGLGRIGAPGGEEAVDRWYPHLLEAYAEGIDRESRLYPGAMAAVERLRAAGYTVGICTNKPAALAELLLARLGVRDAFAALVGADTLPVRKPDPAPLRHVAAALGADRPIYVGDSETDAATAQAADVPFALYTCGYRLTPAEDLPHAFAFDDWAHLPGWMAAQP